MTPKQQNPFGQAIRKRALALYLRDAGEVTAANAWEHVYHLLLSVDRRTRLAHVMDSNHMQPGGNWYHRAIRFTELLCGRWGINPADLGAHVDFMFQHCVREYQAQAAAGPGPGDPSLAMSPPEEVDETGFAREVALLLERKLGIGPSAVRDAVVAEIDTFAEQYFTVEKKRQNVRGEGFEDVLEWLLLHLARVPRDHVRVRQNAGKLPGFEPALASARDKVPKPDLVVVSPDGRLTRLLITAKWSLRQDRLDQFGQEAAYYNAKRTQNFVPAFVLITNEMDLARLRAVLSPSGKGGGFHFDRVYHVNCDLLEETHGAKFDLAAYRADHRLLSISDFVQDCAAQHGAGTTPPPPADPS